MASPDASGPHAEGYTAVRHRHRTVRDRVGPRAGSPRCSSPSATTLAPAGGWPDARPPRPPARRPRRCRRVIDDIVALLSGQPVDLADAPLDMDGLGDLDRQVYEVARTIPPGRTMSYGDIATRLGDPTLARAVGQALGRNPFAIVVPCHRVVGADGRLTGFSANGGVATKERMLVIEGARPESPTLF